MKLKEKDQRPKHQFKLGDTAEIIIKSVLLNVIVLEVRAVAFSTPGLQSCKVIIAGRESEQHAMIRNFIAKKTLSSAAQSSGYEVVNSRMKHTGAVPPEWLASITSQDIANIRFEAILDD